MALVYPTPDEPLTALRAWERLYRNRPLLDPEDAKQQALYEDAVAITESVLDPESKSLRAWEVE